MESGGAEATRVVSSPWRQSLTAPVLNYCGLSRDHIDFICDTTPMKQGKLTPGTHIPVMAYEAFCQSPPDYALLLAWNHAAEIFEKEREFTQRGGKWITFVPKSPGRSPASGGEAVAV